MVTINFEKKHLFLISALIVFLAGIVLVLSYGGNQPSVMGHSVGEINWADTIPSSIKISGSITSTNMIDATNTINSQTALCIKGVCKTSWPSSGGVSSVSGIGGIYNVGGGTTGAVTLQLVSQTCPQGAGYYVYGIDSVGALQCWKPVSTVQQCTYSGRIYTTGAQCCQSDTMKTCQSDGSWLGNNPCYGGTAC